MALIVSELNVYPVKGLKGIPVAAARCTERGLEHDRRWMVVDAHGRFMSQREHPRMATIWTELTSGAVWLSAPDTDPLELATPAHGVAVTVRVWSSTCEAIAAPEAANRWISDCLGQSCRLVYMPEATHRYSNPQYAGPDRLVSFADGYALLVIGQSSLADLNDRLARRSHPPLPMNRFRPSVVVAGASAYAEDDWTRIRVGEAVLRAAKPCGRCQVTTTDQATGEVRDPEPLATLGEYRQSSDFGVIFGMNFVVEKTGRIAQGDPVVSG